MEAPLRARMNEEDMNQRLQYFQQQRQGIDLPHPPVSYKAPSGFPSQVPYDHTQNVPQPSLVYNTNAPTDLELQSSLVATPPTQGVRNLSDQSTKERTAISHVRSRQRITCIHPHLPNQLQLEKTHGRFEMIGARILSVSVPIVDYNLDEGTNVLSVSMNSLDANAGKWESVSLPIGNYLSRRKLLNVLVEALSASFPSARFSYEYDKNGDGRCSIESVVIQEDENEHGCRALYFSASNSRLLDLLGIHVGASQEMIGPQREWDTEEDDGFQVAKLHHSLLVGEYPMNLLLPTHLDLRIPELGAYVMVPLQKARYGEYLFFEPIDEDGVVDLAHWNLAFGGCISLTQLTPQLTYPAGLVYNCRNMPIALHVEFLLETHHQ